NWTVGVNWYWKNLELQADYVWASANDSPANLYVAPVDPRVFEVRLQIYFGP
ncbi:MAG: porin, partial [Rhodanobacteraceae bacterium]